MWSDLDNVVIDFITALEKQLGQEDGVEGTLPLDNLQISISLDQQSAPPVVSWTITVREGLQKVYTLGCTNPEQL